eukprot:GHVS01058414.1.p1 GENE.GHVS01058414.1~~GHVS01058414.1.p1  ORF type:complete len:644 (+),score=257.24 GHVS01058414.1:482-2413(+)
MFEVTQNLKRPRNGWLRKGLLTGQVSLKFLLTAPTMELAPLEVKQKRRAEQDKYFAENVLLKTGPAVPATRRAGDHTVVLRNQDQQPDKSSAVVKSTGDVGVDTKMADHNSGGNTTSSGMSKEDGSVDQFDMYEDSDDILTTTARGGGGDSSIGGVVARRQRNKQRRSSMIDQEELEYYCQSDDTDDINKTDDNQIGGGGKHKEVAETVVAVNSKSKTLHKWQDMRQQEVTDVDEAFSEFLRCTTTTSTTSTTSSSSDGNNTKGGTTENSRSRTVGVKQLGTSVGSSGGDSSGSSSSDSSDNNNTSSSSSDDNSSDGDDSSDNGGGGDEQPAPVVVVVVGDGSSSTSVDVKQDLNASDVGSGSNSCESSGDDTNNSDKGFDAKVQIKKEKRKGRKQLQQTTQEKKHNTTSTTSNGSSSSGTSSSGSGTSSSGSSGTSISGTTTTTSSSGVKRKLSVSSTTAAGRAEDNKSAAVAAQTTTAKSKAHKFVKCLLKHPLPSDLNPSQLDGFPPDIRHYTIANICDVLQQKITRALDIYPHNITTTSTTATSNNQQQLSGDVVDDFGNNSNSSNECCVDDDEVREMESDRKECERMLEKVAAFKSGAATRLGVDIQQLKNKVKIHKDATTRKVTAAQRHINNNPTTH